jgi:hypothetical protein
VPGLLTSWGRELAQRTTRVMQKVQEAELMWSKLKGKGKTTVIEELHKEAQREKLEKLLAKRAVIQEMINNLQK